MRVRFSKRTKRQLDRLRWTDQMRVRASARQAAETAWLAADPDSPQVSFTAVVAGVALVAGHATRAAAHVTAFRRLS